MRCASASRRSRGVSHAGRLLAAARSPVQWTRDTLAEAAITINADAAAVPDSDVLAECMRDGFNEVTKLA